MTVSIITATYNSAKTVKDAVESVRQQTYKNIEHIIVDGLSKDETLEILDAYKHLKVFSEKDNGIYDAMNKGISKVNSDIVGILNSDDFYADEHVIEQVVNIFNKENCDAVYGDLFYVQETDTNKIVRKWFAGKFQHRNFKWGWMPPHPTVFVKKTVYEKFDSFNLQLKSAADYELMLRLMYKHKIKVAYLPKVLVKMRIGGQSNRSFANRIFANKEDRMAWKINNLRPYFFTLTLKPLRKIFQFIS